MSRVIKAFAQFFDGAGDPLVLGWLEFLASGTTNTQKNTYSDVNLTLPNANPIQLDAEGRCPNVFGQGIYKVKLYSHDPVTGMPNVLLQEFDNVVADYGSPGAGENFEEWRYESIYEVNHIVTYNEEYFKSTLSNNEGNTPGLTSTYWEKIDFLRYWNPNVTYRIDDVVVYSGAMYFSLINGNLNNIPFTSPAEWTPVGNGTILLNWEENSTTFRPKVSGYNIGDPTHLLGDVYLDTSSYIYLGTSQEARIQFDVSNNFNIRNTGGQLRLATDSADYIWFITDNTFQWAIESSGDFRPNLTDTLSIGLTGKTIRNIYIGEAGRIYLGASQEGSFYFDGTHLRLFNNSGNIYIENLNGQFYLINGGYRWQLNSSGHWMPFVTDTQSLGITTNVIRNIYLGEAGKLFFGTSQDIELFYDGSKFSIINSTDYIQIDSAGDIDFLQGGFLKWTIRNLSSGDIRPAVDNARNIGDATHRLDSLWIANQPDDPSKAANKDYVDQIKPNPNLLINGSFQIYQRGTAWSAPSYGPDRWYMGLISSAALTTASVADFSTAVPAMWWATSGSVNAPYIEQRMEAQESSKLVGKDITITCWVANNTGNTALLCLLTYPDAGVDNWSSAAQLDSHEVFPAATATGGYIKYTFTFSNIGANAANGLGFRFVRVQGAASTTYITLVKAELGEVSTPFIFPKIEDELLRCQRYYEKSHNLAAAPGTTGLENKCAMGIATDASTILIWNAIFKVTKRIQPPTVEFYSYNGTPDRVSQWSLTGSIGTALSCTRLSQQGLMALSDSGAGFSAGAYYWFAWIADAEL